jgi:hypothetical protein
LEGRTEGLLGFCLAVGDFAVAARHLAEKGISVAVRDGADGTPFARIPSERTHGVGVFLTEEH